MKSEFLRNKKNTFIVIVVFVILIIASLILYNYHNNKINEDKSITRLTNEFNSNQTKSNGLKGSDFYAKDQDGNILKEHLGEYEINEADKSDDNKLKKKAEKIISDFTDSINNNDFQKAYSLFNEDYITDFDYSLEIFKAAYLFNQNISSYEITNIKQNDSKDRVIVTTKFSIGTTGSIKLVDFTLYDNGTIADIPIYLTVNIDKEKEEDKVTYKILKKYETRLGSIFSIEIDNNSEQLINIDNLLIKHMDNICTYEIVSKDTVIRAYPGQPFKFMIKIPNTDGIDSFIFKYKDVDNICKEVELF